MIFYYGLPLDLTDKAPTPPEWELFDLQNDPSEMNNVYGEEGYEAITEALKQELKSLQLHYQDEGQEYPELATRAARAFLDDQ